MESDSKEWTKVLSQKDLRVDLETIMTSGWIAVEADTHGANKKATYDHYQIDHMGGGVTR